MMTRIHTNPSTSLRTGQNRITANYALIFALLLPSFFFLPTSDLYAMGDFAKEYFPKYKRQGPIFHYTVSIANPDAAELDVELEVFGLRSGKQDIGFLGKEVKDVIARNAFGNRLEIRAMGESQEQIFGYKTFLWQTAVPFDRFLRLNYKAPLYLRRPRSSGTVYGRDIFLFPLRALRKSRFLVEFRLPEGWEAFGAWQKAEGAFTPAELAELLHRRFAVGKYVKLSRSEENLAADVIFGAEKDAPALQSAADNIFANLKAQMETFKGAPKGERPWRVLAICDFDSSLKNRGIVSSEGDELLFILAPGPDNLPDMFSAIAENTFRFWNPYAFRPADAPGGGPEACWIADGMAEYYALKSRRAAGKIDEKQFEKALKAVYKRYIDNPLRQQAALPEVYLKKAQDEAAAQLLYSKGTIVAYVLDKRINGETGGKYSLDEVMRRLYNDYNHFRGSEGYTNKTIIQMLAELTGRDYRPFFSDYILGTKEIIEADLAASK